MEEEIKVISFILLAYTVWFWIEIILLKRWVKKGMKLLEKQIRNLERSNK